MFLLAKILQRILPQPPTQEKLWSPANYLVLVGICHDWKQYALNNPQVVSHGGKHMQMDLHDAKHCYHPTTASFPNSININPRNPRNPRSHRSRADSSHPTAGRPRRPPPWSPHRPRRALARRRRPGPRRLNIGAELSGQNGEWNHP